MRVAATLSFYVARQFTYSVLAMLAALTGLVSLFDFIELLRRAATRDNVGLGLVAEIAVLRVPSFCIEILPFAVLLGGILAFWRLTRSSELIVARAAGVSAWQFLAAPLGCALMIGAFATGAISPLSSMMYARAETLDDLHLRSVPSEVALNGGQLWLRQADHGLVDNGVAILHARSVRLRHRHLGAGEVSIFRLDDADHLLLRVEARTASLGDGAWTLGDARTIKPDHLPVRVGTMDLPTDLTVRRVQEGFASPETLSVWALPSGVGAGFALFAVSKVAAEFGQSGALPPLLAAWAPAVAGLLLSLALLLHLEDG